MFDVDKDEITGSSIPRVVALLALPLVAQNIVQVANSVLDVFWLGWLGDSAVAGVGLMIPVHSLAMVTIIAAFVGTQVVVSQRIGDDDHEGARVSAVTGVGLAIASGIVVAGVVLLSADAIPRLLGATGDVAELATAYLIPLFLFYPFVSGSDALEGALIGAGDSGAAFRLNALAVGINVVLDPLLIFGLGPFPELGVFGAALSNSLGYTAAFLLAVYYVTAGQGRDSINIDTTHLKFDRPTAREIVSVGWPVGGQRAAAETARVTITALVGIIGGAAALTAWTIGTRVASIAVVPASGLQQAVQTAVGQNIGAERIDRADRATLVGTTMAVSILFVIGGLQFVFAPEIAAIFGGDATPTARSLTTSYLQILGIGYWAIGASAGILGGFNGTGNTRISFFIDVVKYWFVRFPAAALALSGVVISVAGISIPIGLSLGVETIFWAVTCSNIVAAVGAFAYYKYRTSGTLLEEAASATGAD